MSVTGRPLNDPLRDAPLLHRLECWQVAPKTPWQQLWNVALKHDITEAIAEIKQLREQLKEKANGR